MIDYNLLKGKITAMQSTEPEYAFNFLNNAQNPSTEWECIEDMLDSMEVYEAEPVKHGNWEKKKGYLVCSNCGMIVDTIGYTYEEQEEVFRYCSCCGYRMDGEQNDE